jgi:2'-5' RNA ligase
MDTIGILSILEDQPYKEVKQLWKLYKKQYNSIGVQTFNHPNLAFQGGEAKEIKTLTRDFKDFAAEIEPFEIEVDGFGSFNRRVIYLRVKKSREIIRINKAVNQYLKSHLVKVFEEYTLERWIPHITLAMDDLVENEFDRAWGSLSGVKFRFEQKLSNICLVKRYSSGKIKILRKYLLYVEAAHAH